MTKKNNNKDVKKESKLEVIPEVKQDENLTELLSELKSMKAELESIKKEKELSNKEREAIDDARDDMLLDDDVGALYIDEKYKDENYKYIIVDSTRTGRVNLRLRQGYEVVEDEDFQVGSGTISNTKNLASQVTVELGRNHGSRLGIVMRMPLEKYNKRQQAKVRRNNEQTGQLMQDMADKSDFGSIEIGSDSYKK